MPSLPSDAAAEEFLETANVSKFDLSGFKPPYFETKPEGRRLMHKVIQLLPARG